MIEKDVRRPVVLDSPVEFAITGPAGGRDRVLVRSRRAGLDIVGTAAQALNVEQEKGGNLSFLLTLTPPINVVSSFTLGDIEPESDRRNSSFRFAWKGYSQSREVKEVERLLNLQIVDIQLAIKARDRSDLEFALASIIYRCKKANDRLTRYRNLIWIGVGVYVLIGAIAAIVTEISKVVK